MTILIDQATGSDLDELARIYRDGRRQAMAWVEPHRFSLGDFFEETAGELILVARSGSRRALGFVSCWQADDFIHMLFVRDQWHGQGIGTALLEALPGWEERSYRLKCLVKNPSAMQFYRRRGFSVCGHGSSPEGNYNELVRTRPAPGSAAPGDDQGPFPTELP